MIVSHRPQQFYYVKIPLLVRLLFFSFIVVISWQRHIVVFSINPSLKLYFFFIPDPVVFNMEYDPPRKSLSGFTSNLALSLVKNSRTTFKQITCKTLTSFLFSRSDIFPYFGF